MHRTEEEFLQAIDCRFPYGDTGAAHSLIDEACAISSNAAFMVAHELARPPLSAHVDSATRRMLLDRLGERMTHPLKGPVLDVARRMVRGDSLTAADCCELMARVAAYPGEFNALAVVYCACAPDSTGADPSYERIVAEWRRLESR